MRTLVSALVILALGAPALGESMICTNPGRDYLVLVDGGDVVLDPDTSATRYDSLAQIGDLTFGTVPGEEGMAFVASTGEAPSMRYFADAELIQTDECRLQE